MHVPRPRRLTALALGTLMVGAALPAAATPGPAPTEPGEAADDQAEPLGPVLPLEYEPATATPEQEESGAPTLSPADGTRLTGTQTLVASRTATDDPVTSLAVDDEPLTTSPTLGGDEDATFMVDIGSNAMGISYANYLVINGTRVTILEQYSNATTDIPVSSTGFDGDMVLQRSGLLAGVVEVFVLDGRDESDLAVQASVVVPVGLLKVSLTSGLGRQRDGLVVDEFVFNRSELAESTLPSATVVGPFDPVHDREPELVAGGPSLPVEHVVLQRGEEAFHRRVVPGSPDPAHGTDEAAMLESELEFPGTKLGRVQPVDATPGC